MLKRACVNSGEYSNIIILGLCDFVLSLGKYHFPSNT